MARLTGVLHASVGLPTGADVSLPKLQCLSKQHAECADCKVQSVAQLREAIRRLEAAIASGIDALDRAAGDPDQEMDDERELDEDFEPTLGWNEPDAPKGLWRTDGGLGRDGDED
jgi:hypothetical protein